MDDIAPLTLAALGRALVSYEIVREGEPMPVERPGKAYLWAGNGIWLRGADQRLSVTVKVGDTPAVPGLADLAPEVSWRGWPGRLPGSLLGLMLAHARQARSSAGDGQRPIEQAYLLMLHQGSCQLIIPPQQATASRVAYQIPDEGMVLCDAHSHHEMPAYFSGTDDRDDLGLSVSAVFGAIFERPTLLTRLNCYGHRQLVPATIIFDQLGPFRDGFQGDRSCRS